MPVAIALYQPDIAQNTGTIMRLCACMSTKLHIIHPTGFTFSERSFRRAGMDYVDHADFMEHDDFAAFDVFRRDRGQRLVLLTTKASRSAYDIDFSENDILMLGRESAGVPDAVANAVDIGIRIPMANSLRSINVAMSTALILGEAKRQTDEFKGLA